MSREVKIKMGEISYIIEITPKKFLRIQLE